MKKNSTKNSVQKTKYSFASVRLPQSGKVLFFSFKGGVIEKKLTLFAECSHVENEPIKKSQRALRVICAYGS